MLKNDVRLLHEAWGDFHYDDEAQATQVLDFAHALTDAESVELYDRVAKQQQVEVRAPEWARLVLLALLFLIVEHCCSRWVAGAL